MDQYEVFKPIVKNKFTVVYRARRRVDNALGTYVVIRHTHYEGGRGGA